MHKPSTALNDCLKNIEQKLNWGPGEHWTTNDFKSLSEKIHAATGTTLSIATLKRLWGTIDYQSQPTATTLNALAQYLGFESWLAFQHSRHFGDGHVQSVSEQLMMGRRRYQKALIWLVPLLIVAAVLAYFFQSQNSKDSSAAASADFSFSSRMAVSEGVPNSVIFDYDAAAASNTDTVYIQQSWDKKLRQQVPRDKKIHTSIYYHPGYFQAKLVLNDSIVKEHPLYITTKGWLPLVEQEMVPVYFNASDVITHTGAIELPLDLIRANNIPLQPETPWVSYYNIREFESVKSDHFVLETEVKSGFSDGAGVCQHVEIHLLLQGGAIVVPLAIKGCVSGIAIYDMDGMVADPSSLGVDFSDWVKVRYESKDKFGRLFINDKLAYDSLNLDFAPVKVVGLRYRFQGTGSVNYVKLWGADPGLVYEEEF